MKPSVKALIVNNKKLLLILRDNIPTITDPNKWSLAGGEIEEGETDRQALIRELQEELNMQPKQVIYLGKMTVGVDHSFYFVPLNDEEVSQLKLGNEGQEFKFFSVDEISNLDLAQNIAKYFPLVKDHLKEIIEEDKKPDLERLGLSISH